jgi:acetylornithine deacetylase
MSELTSLLRKLVAIDSVNPDLVPGGAGEGELARFVAEWLEHAGLDVTVQDAGPGRPNVIARVKGTGNGRSLMLNAHLDTVGYAGMDRPLEPVIAGNRLYGRGAFDMKGSLAAIMSAGATLASDPPAGDVILTAVVDEEFASIGTQAVADSIKADAAIITEPTGLEVCIAHKGFVWFEIETKGVAAHGSRPDLGIDAIAKMGQVLVELEQLDRELHRKSVHPLVRTGSIHASLIEGGTELSTYPDRCRLQIERRTIPGETAEVAEAQLAAILARCSDSDPAFNGTLTRGIARRPFEIDHNAEIVRILMAARKRITGRTSEPAGAFGWMDSAILDEAGIPTVIFGPGGEGAHAAVEWVDLDDVEQCRDVYVAVAREFCR